MQKDLRAQSKHRFSVSLDLFLVKPAYVLPEPLGSYGGIAAGSQHSRSEWESEWVRERASKRISQSVR